MTFDVHAHVVVPEITRHAGAGEPWRPHVFRDDSGAQVVEMNGKQIRSAIAEFVDVDGILTTQEEAGGDRPEEAHVRSVLKSRLASGEFDKAIADLEALPYDQYTRFVAASAPIVDAKENRYYISLKGDLYLYVGPPKPENRFFLDRGVCRRGIEVRLADRGVKSLACFVSISA